MKNSKENLILFSKVMWGVADDFGGKISEDGMMMRFRVMQEYSIDQITKAGTWLLRHREKTFPAVPTTKEFLDVIEGFSKPQVSAAHKAEIQANLVLNKLYQDGAAAKVDFEDATTQKLMTGRWSFFRWGYDLVNDQVPWWKKEFIAAYIAHSEAEEAENLILEGPGKENIVPIENLKKLIGQK